MRQEESYNTFRTISHALRTISHALHQKKSGHRNLKNVPGIELKIVDHIEFSKNKQTGIESTKK